MMDICTVDSLKTRTRLGSSLGAPVNLRTRCVRKGAPLYDSASIAAKFRQFEELLDMGKPALRTVDCTYMKMTGHHQRFLLGDLQDFLFSRYVGIPKLGAKLSGAASVDAFWVSAWGLFCGTSIGRKRLAVLDYPLGRSRFGRCKIGSMRIQRSKGTHSRYCSTNGGRRKKSAGEALG
jgi:hypothetical protein